MTSDIIYILLIILLSNDSNEGRTTFLDLREIIPVSFYYFDARKILFAANR